MDFIIVENEREDVVDGIVELQRPGYRLPAKLEALLGRADRFCVSANGVRVKRHTEAASGNGLQTDKPLKKATLGPQRNFSLRCTILRVRSTKVIQNSTLESRTFTRVGPSRVVDAHSEITRKKGSSYESRFRSQFFELDDSSNGL